MNHMIRFAEENRTTDFFRDLEIFKIRCAYRVMEYFAPDAMFRPKIDDNIKQRILLRQFAGVADEIADEISNQYGIDLGSSMGYEEVTRETAELIAYLLPKYLQSITDAKEQKRADLLKQLAELDS